MKKQKPIATISMPEDQGTYYEQFQYPGGEYQVRLTQVGINRVRLATVEGGDIVLTARINDGNPMPLLLLIDAIQNLECFTVTHTPKKGRVKKSTQMNRVYPKIILRLPYLPYARADRRFVEGDCFGLEVFGKLFGIFGAFTPLYIDTIDAHSPVARKKVWHLRDFQPTQAIQDVVKELGRKNLAILLPDKGAGRYDLHWFNGPIYHADKVRDAKSGALLRFDVPLMNAKKVLIVDDICDGGGTFIGIADVIKEQQPHLDLHLYVTHGIFSKGMDELNKRFKSIRYTDSFLQK